MELEIKVMWCKGLTAFNFFQKLAVYASVSITPDEKTLKLTQDQKQEQKTPVDQEGNGNPEWNYTMKFNLSPSNISSNLRHLSILFQLRHHGQLFGDKDIGEVRVPLNDLVQSVGVGVGRLVSYEVRGTDGKHNGILDFSYKVMDKLDLENCCTVNQPIQISGYGHQSVTSDSGRIQYPRIDCDMCLNPTMPPLLNDPIGHQPPSLIWGPPPPPPPPRYPPPHPPPHQQPYALQPPPYGEPYWAYQTPAPNYQQPTGDGYDYRHW